MPTSDAVWGIDIGQCALKAMRCSPHELEGKLVADAFDFIEYPQILSQPDADPITLVADAIKTFLSRNNVKGDKVAVSVPGQSGLARYIKIPPVEAKKIPDLVKYEARQQIPFALEDVIWDYQKMPGGVEEEGYVLDTEVGLFAMKREQVFKALKPFQDADIEIDMVQLAPVAIYNFVNFDQISSVLEPSEQFANKWVVVLSMGTDTTDLVVTNGGRMWQRSIPLGGNHFTRALTKEMKLTFAKAEHLKRNATKAEDPKALYQAMRGVFNDLVTEVHRSLSFFSSLEKEAEIKCILAMGNTLKLQGLQSFLAKSLEYKVVGVESFKTLAGPSVVAAPAFKDNLLAFGVCYGLCVQGQGESKLRTNLLPREILKERLIREKKPWAVAAAAALLLGCGINFFGSFRSYNSALPKTFEPVIKKTNDVANASSKLLSDLESSKKEFQTAAVFGKELLRPAENRETWLEMLRAVNQCLPQADPKVDLTVDLMERDVIYIDSFDCEYQLKLEDWFAGVKPEWKNQQESLKAKLPAPVAAATGDATKPAEGNLQPSEGPSGPGWVIQLNAHHFHNKDERNFGFQYVRNSLILNLLTKSVEVPQIVNGKPQSIKLKLKDLGIDFPVCFSDATNFKRVEVQHPDDIVQEDSNTRPSVGGGLTGTRPGAEIKPRMVSRADFSVQFVWKETPYAKRQENKKAAAAAAANATAGAPTNNPTGGE